MTDNNDYTDYFFGYHSYNNQYEPNNAFSSEGNYTNEGEIQEMGYNPNSWATENCQGQAQSYAQPNSYEQFQDQTQVYQSSDYSNFDFDAQVPVQPSYNPIDNLSWAQQGSSMAIGNQNCIPENNGFGYQAAPEVSNNSMETLEEKVYGDSPMSGSEFNMFGARTASRPDSKLLNLANQSSDKTVSNANGVKNYITITSKTFAKFILESVNQEIERIITQSIQEQRPSDFYAARNAVMEYITKEISGKKVHKNGSKQYKITARKDIETVFFPQKKDCADMVSIKQILRNMMERFLRSQTFQDWIITEYEAKSSGGKDFYLDHRNLEQIVGVYVDQDFKPRFN